MTKREELEKELDKVYKKLIAHEQNIKVWEAELQKAIETVFPGSCWWHVTGCDIFMCLLVTHSPKETIKAILNDIKLTEV